MKDSIRSLISLSSAERKGVTVLIVIILIILGVQAYRAFHLPGEETLVDSALIREMAEFEKHLIQKADYKDSVAEYTVYSETAFEPEPFELFRFDPNTVSAADLKRLGLNRKLIRTLINYRMHGGKFRKPEDMNRIYGMNSAIYSRLSPYIIIPVSDERQMPIKNKMPIENKIVAITPKDINLADSADLIALNGIGQVLSRRIIKFRNALGGFYDTRQLAEVYGISDSALAEVYRFFYADTAQIRKINLNTASEGEMARHPYIGKFAARSIIRYRSSVQQIISADEMKTNGLLTSEQFKKVEKYLRI